MTEPPSRYRIQTLLDNAVQPCRPLTDDEFTTLVTDLKRTKRPMVPVAMSSDGVIFDGTHRLKAMLDLGHAYINAGDVRVYPDVNAKNITERAITLNAARRQWTTEEKIVVAQGLHQDGWSQGKIARAFGVSQQAVSQWLNRDEAPAPSPSMVEGLDGKRYPVPQHDPETPQRPPREPKSTHPWAPSGPAYRAAQQAQRHLEHDRVGGLNEIHKAKAIDAMVRLRDAIGAWLAEAGWEE
jgi:transposase-like protein